MEEVVFVCMNDPASPTTSGSRLIPSITGSLDEQKTKNQKPAGFHTAAARGAPRHDQRSFGAVYDVYVSSVGRGK